MMDDAALLKEFNANAKEFFTSNGMQRDEIQKSFAYRDCQQWDWLELQERKRLDKSVTIVNLSAPLIRAVSGTECMQDNKLAFVSMDETMDEDADDIEVGVDYLRYSSGYDSEKSMAKEDAATCGLAATVTWLDMTNKQAIAGQGIVERIFPGFLFYDNSGRGSRLNAKARWCGYADPVNRDDLSERIRKAQKGKEVTEGTWEGGGDYSAFLMNFVTTPNVTKIDFAYHYFWWEFEPLYDVMNPFAGEDNELAALMQNDDDVTNIVGEAADKIGIDWKASWWTLDAEGFKLLKRTLETVGLLTGLKVEKLNSSEREGKCYYRATIARGVVLSKGKCYTQGRHPLNFITGYYDETKSIYYGMMRPLSYIQDALNVSMSDFLTYAKSAAHGGNAWIKGAGESIEALKKSKANQDSMTPLPNNAEIIPKETPGTPQVLVEFIRLLMEIMPRTLGLGQEFMGIISSGDMTDSLYGKVMKQSYAVLANFANNSAAYDVNQGHIFEDLFRSMISAEDGKLIPIITPGDSGEDKKRVYKQNLSREYTIRIVERPMTTDERQDTFNKLSQLVPMYMQAGMNIMPVLTKYANLDAKDKQEIAQLSAPAPTPPDPLNQALLQSQISLGNAQAKKSDAEAQQIIATLGKVAEEKESIIDKNNAAALKAFSEAGSVAAEIGAAEAAAMMAGEAGEGAREE